MKVFNNLFLQRKHLLIHSTNFQRRCSIISRKLRPKNPTQIFFLLNPFTAIMKFLVITMQKIILVSNKFRILSVLCSTFLFMNHLWDSLKCWMTEKKTNNCVLLNASNEDINVGYLTPKTSEGQMRPQTQCYFRNHKSSLYYWIN